MTFKFHSDAGHGWLAVKLNVLKELGLMDYVTIYSKRKGQTAYLEEDCDMAMFIRHYTAKYGVEPKIDQLPSKDRSPIRSYEGFINH